MPFLRRDDVPIYHEVLAGGDGPSVVLLHALGTSGRLFHSVFADRRAPGPVLRVDFRGHGASGVTAPEVTLDDLVDDVAAVIEHVGWSGCLVAGVSLGGVVAIGLAQRHPRLVGGLLLAHTAAQIGTAELWQTRIDAVGANGLAAHVGPIVRRWFGRGYVEREPDAAAGWRDALARSSTEGYAAACAALRDADYRDALGAIEVPTLCLAGDEDVATPPDTLGALAAGIESAQVRTLEGVAHLSPLEAPERFAEAVRDVADRMRCGPVDSRGDQARRAVLGDAYVDGRRREAGDRFGERFQTFITTGAWAQVWGDSTLTRRERSLLTVAILAALGRTGELAQHVEATIRTGASVDDIREALMHVAVYAGAPAANTGFKVARRVLARQDRLGE